MKTIEIKHINKVGGGFVKDFKRGIFKDVYVFDFSSFYPTTILTYNISPETIIDKKTSKELDIETIKIPEDYHEVSDYLFEEKYFRKDIQGVLPEIIEEFIKLRYEKKYKKFEYKDTNPELYKKLKAEELALKIILNSFYGITAFKNSRFYNPILANAITQHCRHLIKKCIEFAKENGWIPIYSDTDSVALIKSKKDLNEYELNELFKEFINNFVKQCGVNENKWIKLEFEKKIDKLVYFKKKKYASLLYELDDKGNIVGEPEIDIKGLDIIRRDVLPLGRELQKRLVVDCWLLEKLTEDEFIEELYELKQKIINGDIEDKYIIIKKGLSKPINSYGKPVIDSKTGQPKIKKDGTIQIAPIPIHVQVAKKMIEDGYEVNVGDVISYVIIEHKPKLKAIPVYEFEKTKQFDKEYYWEKAVTPVINALSTINPDLILKNEKLWWIKPPRGRLTLRERLERIIKKYSS